MKDEMTLIVDVWRMPQPILLYCSWGVAGLTTLVTLPLAISRLRKGRTVFRIIAINRVVALATGLASICAIIGQVNILLWNQGTVEPSAYQAQMASLRLSQVLNQLALSLLLSGINLLLALILSQKWKEPQQTAAASPVVDR